MYSKSAAEFKIKLCYLSPIEVDIAMAKTQTYNYIYMIWYKRNTLNV